jgi:hypothetical protein
LWRDGFDRSITFAAPTSPTQSKCPALVSVGLIDVVFGEELETIGFDAFYHCTSLRRLTIPSVRTIEAGAFSECTALTDVDLPKVETMGEGAFLSCTSLRRVAMPLKDDMIGHDAFHECDYLERVELVGGIHKTIASLHLER